RRTILDLGGTNVRPNGVGGLYFVKQECAPALEALEKFVSLIPGEIEVHTLPLIDDMKQRQMVRRAFEAESVDAVDRMLGDIKEVMDRGKKISKDRYASFVTEYQDLLSKTQDYEQVLETALAETHTR